MLEAVIELGLCLLLGLASLLVVVWDVASGRIVYLDGITLALLSLTLGGFFMFNVFWSWRSSELKTLLAEMRKGSGSSDSSSGESAGQGH
ncbi:MAG TPA: hypothetical protein VKU44_00710 [Terriglobia bacterium]|nr:hypothetical protein [Terriglobia bacterium]